MTITVNGIPRELTASTTIESLVGELAGSTRGVAVAVDATVVPRQNWLQTPLRDGSTVEILTAVQGG
jgi:sulfur carrier protein